MFFYSLSLTLKATLRAMLDVPASACCATSGEIIHEALFPGRYREGLRIAWTKPAQELGHDKASVILNRRLSYVEPRRAQAQALPYAARVLRVPDSKHRKPS